MENNEVLLKVDHLCQYFRLGRKDLKAVDDVSFEIKKGESFGLVGESGCGKTTTGRSIIKLYDITSGSVYFKGERICAGVKSYKDAIAEAKKEKRGCSDPKRVAELDKIIADNKDDPSMLMGVMQQAQDIYGYLPIEVQKIIADGMGVPLEKVYGVATFYAQFALSPKGKYNISVCLGTACYVKGAGEIFDKLSERLGIGADECTADGKYSLTACRCIGACGLAPVLTVNEDVYGRLTAADVDDILAKYQ